MSDLPDGWSVAPLGELCRIELGRTPARANARCWDNEKSTSNVWLSISDMPSSLHAVATDSREYVSDAAADEMKLVPEGTLLASFKLTLGRLCYAGRDLYTNEAIAALLDLDRERLSKEYLYWYLTFFDWDAAAEGDEKVKGKTLNKAKLKILPIYIPPLDEQKRIVAVLDQAFAALDRARANAEANLADAELVFDETLAQVFSGNHAGWKAKRLDEVCAITSSLIDPRHSKYIHSVHVGAGNIESKTGKLLNLKTSYEEELISGKFPFDESMVLYSKIRPYLEKVARPDFNGVCSADMYPLAPIEGQITRDFLYWLLLSKPFTTYAIEGSARAGMPKVNRDHLFQYEVELPEIDEQQRIVAKLDAMRTEVMQVQATYERKLTDLTTLRQSLLQAAFSGQLS